MIFTLTKKFCEWCGETIPKNELDYFKTIIHSKYADTPVEGYIHSDCVDSLWRVIIEHLDTWLGG